MARSPIHVWECLLNKIYQNIGPGLGTRIVYTKIAGSEIAKPFFIILFKFHTNFVLRLAC